MGSFVLLLVIVMLCIAALAILRDVFVYVKNGIPLSLSRYRPLSNKHKQLLEKYSAYYNILSEKDQLKFQQRVHKFMYSKRFIARGFDHVTDEMLVLISATAVQLTFGLPQIYLAHFNKILIYPDSYYSQINQVYHVGEVNPRLGAIILSWKSFVQGYADPSDCYNVGIHEMAHAIHFENRIQNSEFDFLDKRSLAVLRRITAQEIPRLRRGELHFFRSYAGTNEHEFFAVALEYFFEQPKEFMTAMPELYFTLAHLLNQNPANLYGLT